jgi:hypothetical protein
MEKKIVYYECKKCGTRIPPDTNGVFTKCECGKIAIDGTPYYTRIIGDFNFVIQSFSPPKETYVYRIKQVSTGMFYRGYKWRGGERFTKTGKFYGKNPGLGSIILSDGECVVEKYKIAKI